MALSIGADMPPLSGATEWLNDEVDVTGLRGRPVLIHFWSLSCGICKLKMPALHLLRDRFAGDGLVTVAVHVPRTPADVDSQLVAKAASELGMSEPCALDHRLVIAQRFENQFVPAYYVFDHDARMRARAAGANGPTIITAPLERLFAPAT